MGYKISERLRELREEKGWDTHKAARKCGFKDKKAIWQIETYFTNFGVDKLAQICRGYGVSADYVIGLTQTKGEGR